MVAFGGTQHRYVQEPRSGVTVRLYGLEFKLSAVG